MAGNPLERVKKALPNIRTPRFLKHVLRQNGIPHLEEPSISDPDIENPNAIFVQGQVFDKTPSLPQAEIIPATLELITNQDMWRSKEAVVDSIVGIIAATSRINQVLMAILDCPPDNTTEAAAGIIADDNTKYAGIKAVQTPQELSKWWVKLKLGQAAHNIIAVRAALDRRDLSPQRKRLLTAVEANTNTFASFLDRLSLQDLELYIHFGDMFSATSDLELANKPVPPMPQSEDQQTAGMKAVNALLEDRQTLDYQITMKDKNAWARLQRNWTGRDIQMVISLIPTMIKTRTMLNLYAALGSNLLTVTPQQLVENGAFAKNVDAEALAKFAAFPWMDEDFKHAYTEYYPVFAEAVGETETHEGFSVKRERLPFAAIELFEKLSRVLPQDEFATLLADTQTHIAAKSALPWMLTLLTVEYRNPSVKAAHGLLPRIQGLPPQVINTLADRQVGKVWLTSGGKLTVTDLSVNSIRSAFPLYTSKKEPPQVAVVHAPPPKKEENQTRIFLAKKVTRIPSIGDVGIPNDEDLPRLFATALFNAAKRSKPETTLRSIEENQLIWQETPLDRILFYPTGLPGQVPSIKEAGQCFNGVYLDGNKMLFVVNNSITTGYFYGSTLPVGITALLDSEGYIHIQGDDDGSLTFTPEGLFLNDLALTLGTQQFHLDGIISAYYDRNHQQDLHALRTGIADYNRSSQRELRGFAKLVVPTSQKDAQIALLVPGYRLPFLVGEKKE